MKVSNCGNHYEFEYVLLRMVRIHLPLSIVRPSWRTFFTLCNFGIQQTSEITTIREVFFFNFSVHFLNSRMVLSSEQCMYTNITYMICHFKIM